MTPLEDNLLTLRDVARYLAVSEKTVRRWVAARRIPCLRREGRKSGGAPAAAWPFLDRDDSALRSHQR